MGGCQEFINKNYDKEAITMPEKKYGNYFFIN